MPRAEVGSTKYVANKMKSKGLQRLRWYCQVCEKQCRDENGFKCHTQSESHVRQMMVIGSNPNKAINEYSKQFERDFMQQLKTAHGTKPVQINHFYQEYIANKEHIHMNATKWPSLTEFAKYLGRGGICRVEETEKGLHIAWIDNSPEALRRQDAIRKKERMEKGDEERQQKLLNEQIARAQQIVKQRADREESQEDTEKETGARPDGEKIAFSLGAKPVTVKPPTPPTTVEDSANDGSAASEEQKDTAQTITPPPENGEQKKTETKAPAVKMSLGGAFNKPKNVFATKKNPLTMKKAAPMEQPKKMSEAERIMKEEMERKRTKGFKGFGDTSNKRQKLG